MNRFAAVCLGSVFLGGMFLGALVGCAPTREALPPPPPAQPADHFRQWQAPPPLAADVEAPLAWSVKRTELPNGLGVTVITRPETATLALQLFVPGARDISEGPVAVMAEALRAGTKYGSGEPLVNPKLGHVPIQVWTDAVATTFLWQVLPRAAEQAVGLLGAFVLAPAFDPAEVQIRLQQELALIQRTSASIASLTLAARGNIPGLGRPSNEQDARGLITLKPEQLREIHACTIRPADAELVLVGPIDAARVNAWAQAAFGAWKEPASGAACDAWRKPAIPEAPAASRLDTPVLQLIHSPSGDPWMALEVPGPGVESDDFLPFQLLVKLLENRDSGTVKKLRHMGATYGIQAGTVDRYNGLSLLEMQGQIEENTTEVALRKLIEDIRGLAQSLDAAELESIKRRWRNELVNSLSDNHSVAHRVVWQLRRGRSPEALPSLPAEFMQVDLARCRQVAERWFSNAQPSITVYGVPATAVRNLGLGVRVQQAYITRDLGG